MAAKRSLVQKPESLANTARDQAVQGGSAASYFRFLALVPPLALLPANVRRELAEFLPQGLLSAAGTREAEAQAALPLEHPTRQTLAKARVLQAVQLCNNCPLLVCALAECGAEGVVLLVAAVGAWLAWLATLMELPV
ncbi:hypothetical protein TSOC_005918 [Tetrabaena socialis]|uniref:Uncharacterized protein n=1 Tax=Tetrabaena socialis TaxID=47790 RepID=A0A2J8A530_9CHLO|nr:hypothetical protein TSOC_005918 [Tetrabaena socialis]|eukprot:PNH07620.1 hypothetical protein TSOC_005918 [Tetrabaena socialis]